MDIASRTYPLGVYRLVLVCAAAIWGLGFVIGKGAIATVGATWFTAIRFLGAGIVLLIILFLCCCGGKLKNFNLNVNPCCLILMLALLGTCGGLKLSPECK